MALHLPTVPEALASLLRTVVVALFLLTFVLQPFLIPSESMEHTLLVGDFLLVNKQIFAPAGGNGAGRWLMPYRDVERGDIVVFHHPDPPYLVKRVVGVPGDRLRIEDGRVMVNGVALDEPYAAFEPVPPQSLPRQFSRQGLHRPERRSRLVAPDAEPDQRRRTGRSRRASTSCSATTATTARIRASGDSCRGRPLWPGRWSFTSRSAGLRPPMCNRPRMIDSDTTGNSRHASRALRAGSAFFRWCTEANRRSDDQPPAIWATERQDDQEKYAASQDAARSPSPLPFKKTVEETPFEAVASICSVLVVGLFILTFLAQNFVIPSGSMENTLLVGDHLVVDRITLAPPAKWMPLVHYREPQRGDVVVFLKPGDRRRWQAPICSWSSG